MKTSASNSREIEHPAVCATDFSRSKSCVEISRRTRVAPSSCCFCALSEDRLVIKDAGGMFELFTEIGQIVRAGVGNEVLLANIQDLREGCAPRGVRLSPAFARLRKFQKSA